MSQNSRESMSSTFVQNDYKDGEKLVSFKRKRQQVSKFKETIKLDKEDEYDELLRLWNITANKGEVKVKIDKLKDDIKTESSVDKLIYYQNDKSYNKVSPTASDTSEDVIFPSNIICNSNTDELKTEKCFENLESDDSLFCDEVKFGIVYTCCFCENVFSSKHTLAKHKRKHNFCQYCKAKFKSMKALTNHRKNCIFKKCMTSHPRVVLSNIGLSRKMRSIYRSAFSRDNFPFIGHTLTFDIKKEIVDNNTNHLNYKINQSESKNFQECVQFPSSRLNNNIVKFEPIEYNESNEYFYKNNQNDIENLVKIEAVDIIEDQLTKFNETATNPIKEEDCSYYPSENSIINTSLNRSAFKSDSKTKIDCDIVNNPGLPMNIDTVISSDKAFESKKNLERKTHANNESYLSDDEYYGRVPRFSRFKSELKKEIFSLSGTEYKFAYEFVKDDEYDVIKNEFLNCLPSKENFNNVETSTAKINSGQTEIEVLKENQSKVIANIPSSKVALLKSGAIIESKSKTCQADSKLVSSQQEPIQEKCGCSSTQSVNEKNNLQSIKLEIKDDPENNLVSSKILKLSKNITPHFGKNTYSQRVKYVRFTNTPNLNLFMF